MTRFASIAGPRDEVVKGCGQKVFFAVRVGFAVVLVIGVLE